MLNFSVGTDESWLEYSQRNRSRVSQYDSILDDVHEWYTTEHMNKDGVWGDSVMFWACSLFYKCDMTVYTHKDRPYTITTPGSRDHIKLGYIPDVHFVSLRNNGNVRS